MLAASATGHFVTFLEARELACDGPVLGLLATVLDSRPKTLAPHLATLLPLLHRAVTRWPHLLHYLSSFCS